MNEPFVAGLVLAAGGSRTAGRPKPLLPFRRATLLDHTLATARACEFDQLLVAVDRPGKVRERVDLSGTQIVGTMGAAMAALDPEATVLVLLRGDQPEVTPSVVRVLLAARGDAPLAVCRYQDARGYPYALSSEVFDDLLAGVTVAELLDAYDVAEVPVAGRGPLDVDSWADYEALVAAAGHVPAAELSSRGADSTGGWRRGLRD
jgi:molybdenum cofactor cytidylyltransferase